MRREIDPQSSPRGRAFELWKNAAMPKVTIIKTFNICRLVKTGRRRGLKTNMLMCWCIGHAANPITEFYTLPAGGRLWQYDCLAVNTVVMTAKGEPPSLRHTLLGGSPPIQRRLPTTDTSSPRHQRGLPSGRTIHGHRHLGIVAMRNRRSGERLFRNVHQSLPGLGQIPAGILQDHAACLLPIPPRPDGRLRSRPLPQRPPRGNRQIRNIAISVVRQRICGSAE